MKWEYRNVNKVVHSSELPGTFVVLGDATETEKSGIRNDYLKSKFSMDDFMNELGGDGWEIIKWETRQDEYMGHLTISGLLKREVKETSLVLDSK